jgi:hypothetical protein
LTGGFEGPDVAYLSKQFPRIYAVASGQAELPKASSGQWQAMEQGVRGLFSLDPRAPMTHELLAEGLRTGKVSPLMLAGLDRAIFDHSADAQGAHADTLERHWSDSQAAAERPAETLVMEDAQRKAEQEFGVARDAAIKRGQESLLAAPKPAQEPTPEAQAAPGAPEATPPSPDDPGDRPGEG